MGDQSENEGEVAFLILNTEKLTPMEIALGKKCLELSIDNIPVLAYKKGSKTRGSKVRPTHEARELFDVRVK